MKKIPIIIICSLFFCTSVFAEGQIRSHEKSISLSKGDSSEIVIPFQPVANSIVKDISLTAYFSSAGCDASFSVNGISIADTTSEKTTVIHSDDFDGSEVQPAYTISIKANNNLIIRQMEVRVYYTVEGGQDDNIEIIKTLIPPDNTKAGLFQLGITTNGPVERASFIIDGASPISMVKGSRANEWKRDYNFGVGEHSIKFLIESEAGKKESGVMRFTIVNRADNSNGGQIRWIQQKTTCRGQEVIYQYEEISNRQDKWGGWRDHRFTGRQRYFNNNKWIAFRAGNYGTATVRRYLEANTTIGLPFPECKLFLWPGYDEPRFRYTINDCEYSSAIFSNGLGSAEGFNGGRVIPPGVKTITLTVTNRIGSATATLDVDAPPEDKPDYIPEPTGWKNADRLGKAMILIESGYSDYQKQTWWVSQPFEERKQVYVLSLELSQGVQDIKDGVLDIGNLGNITPALDWLFQQVSALELASYVWNHNEYHLNLSDYSWWAAHSDKKTAWEILRKYRRTLIAEEEDSDTAKFDTNQLQRIGQCKIIYNNPIVLSDFEQFFANLEKGRIEALNVVVQAESEVEYLISIHPVLNVGLMKYKITLKVVKWGLNNPSEALITGGEMVLSATPLDAVINIKDIVSQIYNSFNNPDEFSVLILEIAGLSLVLDLCESTGYGLAVCGPADVGLNALIKGIKLVPPSTLKLIQWPFVESLKKIKSLDFREMPEAINNLKKNIDIITTKIDC